MDFGTALVDPDDGDEDGTDDRYQVGSGVDTDGNGVADELEEGVCGLRDLRTGGAVGLRASQGRMRCLSIAEAGDLPAGVRLSAEDAPHGFFSFRIEGLVVDTLSPAEVSVTVYLPAALAEGDKWYKYDEATGELSDYSGNVTESGRLAIIRLVDGGAGDADGVVNGVIVDPSGPVTATGAEQIASSGGGTTSSSGSSSGGGGSLGIAEIFSTMMVLFFSLQHRRRSTAVS